MDSIEIYYFFSFVQNKVSISLKEFLNVFMHIPFSKFSAAEEIIHKVKLSFKNVRTIHSVMFCESYEWLRTGEPKATIAFLMFQL